MSTVGIILFWTCVMLIGYSYIVYPVLINLLAYGKKLDCLFYDNENEVLPRVAIIMSVFNEEKVLEQKLQSIMASVYPSNKLTIWIGSDGSTDTTNSIIEKYAILYPNLHLIAYENRRGKTAVISDIYNQLLPWQPEVLIFTDANVLFSETLLYEMVKYFKDAHIGQVGANVQNTIPESVGIAQQEKQYIQRENTIKYNEGVLWGTMQGAFGACYAIRTELYHPFPSVFVADDFYLSMCVLKDGYKAILNPDALCYEDVSVSMHDEFNRKARISAGNFTNLAIFKNMILNPFTAIGFTFISHKLLRWLTPFLLLLMPLCCLAVWNKFYLFLFIVQVLFMLTPIWDKWLSSLRWHIPLFRLIGYFYYMNAALLKGFIQYAKGVKSHVWTSPPRNI